MGYSLGSFFHKGQHRSADSSGTASKLTEQKRDELSYEKKLRENRDQLQYDESASYPSVRPDDYASGDENEFGPWDSRDIDESYLDELDNPAQRPHIPRHSMQPWLDLPVHVWSKQVFFYSPMVESVQSVGLDDVGDQDDAPAREGLVLTLPGYGGRPRCSMTVSVFSAPKNGDQWNESGWRDSFEKLQADGVKVTTPRTPWGVGVHAEAAQQGVYVCGADGARWTVKIVVYSDDITHRTIEMAHEVMRSVVVHRGSEPMGPATPLDMTLIDRRKGRKEVGA